MSELPVTIRTAGSLSTSLTVKARGSVEEFWVTVWSGMSLIDGPSLTGVIVIETVAGSESSDPSFALNVKLSDPFMFAAGV